MSHGSELDKGETAIDSVDLTSDTRGYGIVNSTRFVTVLRIHSPPREACIVVAQGLALFCQQGWSLQRHFARSLQGRSVCNVQAGREGGFGHPQQLLVKKRS